MKQIKVKRFWLDFRWILFYMNFTSCSCIHLFTNCDINPWIMVQQVGFLTLLQRSFLILTNVYRVFLSSGKEHVCVTFVCLSVRWSVGRMVCWSDGLLVEWSVGSDGLSVRWFAGRMVFASILWVFMSDVYVPLQCPKEVHALPLGIAVATIDCTFYHVPFPKGRDVVNMLWLRCSTPRADPSCIFSLKNSSSKNLSKQNQKTVKNKLI